jgi:hypothetical protein
MLKALFTSETRVKLINALLLNPEKKYTVPQLRKEIGSQTASIRKEINNLKEFGLIKSASRNSEAWIVDKDFIIFPELRALIAKAQLLSSQKFINGLKKNFSPWFLALTGFFTGDKLVKTDILIVGKIKRRLFSKLLKKLEADLGKEINYTIMDKTEFLYRQEVMDIFLYNILTGKIIILIDNRKGEKEEKEKNKEYKQIDENNKTNN